MTEQMPTIMCRTVKGEEPPLDAKTKGWEFIGYHSVN